MITKVLEVEDIIIKIQKAYICSGWCSSGYTPDDVVAEITFTDENGIRYYGNIKCGTYRSVVGTCWVRESYVITKPLVKEYAEEYKVPDPDNPDFRSFRGRVARLKPTVTKGDLLLLRFNFEEKISRKGNRYFRLKRVKIL